MRRILVLGNCGTGKTTYSRKLAQKLKLPLHHLDQYYWESNWGRPTRQDWRNKVSKLVSGKNWIIDGSYPSTLDIRIPAADTIIFLDYPKAVALWRAIKRYLINFGKKREDIGGNNIEKISIGFIWKIATFSRKKLLKQINIYRTNQRLIILNIMS